MNMLQATILGIIQGITEFLPISSSGHLVLIPELFGWEQQPTSFDITVHAATLLAIVLYFRMDILDLLKQIKHGTYTLARNILITTIPAGIIGSLFSDSIDQYFKNTEVVIFMLICIGFIMLFIGKLTPGSKKEGDLTATKALIIGAGQALAFIRGTSRSGITIISGMITGLSKESAARYAFMAGIPIMLTVSGLQLLKFTTEGTGSIEISALLVGFLSSFFSGVIAIRTLLAILEKWGLAPFGMYRIILGILLLVLL